MKKLVITLIFISTNSYSILLENMKIDESKKIESIEFISGKYEDQRYHKGQMTQVIPSDIKSLKSAILAFNQRCNNEFIKKRKLTDENYKCKYHNENIIESLVHDSKELKDFKLENNEIDRFLISRRIYNRNHYEHTDMIRVYELVANKEYKISMEMIDDKTVKKFMKPIVKKDSVFLKTLAIFAIKKIDDKSTQLTYTYESVTDHWLLNKSVSNNEIFNSMASSFKQLFKSLKNEASEVESSVAAKK